MTALELLEAIAANGGVVELDSDNRIRYNLAGPAARLVPELIAGREAVRRCLQTQASVPPMPAGVQLLEWKLRPAPALVETVSVVGEPAAFARATLHHLAAALSDPAWHWIVPLLRDRLAQVGVKVTTDNQDLQDHHENQES